MKFVHASKLTIALTLVLITIFSISPLTVLAQADWSGDQLIEDNTGYDGDSPQVAISGSNVVAVWYQYDGSNKRIYSNYSTDGGATWHDDQLIENNTGYDGDSPQVAISGSNVVAVWYQNDSSSSRIFSNYSTDSGATWHDAQLIEDNAGYNGYTPQVAMSGSNVVAVWKQHDGSNSRIFSNYSSNGGSSWGSDQLIEDNNGNNANFPQIAISGSNVVAVWQQGGSIDSIYCNYSGNGGVSWGSDQLIEDNAAYTAEYPQVAISDSKVVAVWKQDDGTNTRIYSNYSSNGGASWESDQLIEDNTGYDGNSPQVAMSGSNAVAVWSQSVDGCPRIYNNYSTDCGATWKNDQLIEDNSFLSGYNPQIAISGSNVIAVWSQHYSGRIRIFSNYSGNGGASWQGKQFIEDNSPYSGYNPQVAMSGLNTIAVWKQDDGSSDRIYSNYRDINPLIPLVSGWNLISLPLIPDSTDIADVISNSNLASGDTANIVMVYNYNTSAEKWLWWNGTPESTLNTMEDGIAYWIYATIADTLTVHGTQTGHPGPDYPVHTGWNMIGFTSTSDMAVETYLASEDGNYSLVYCWVDGGWLFWATGGGTFTSMEPGCGYWLYMNAAGAITPP